MRIYLVGKKAIDDDLYMLVDDIDADLTRSLWSLGSSGGYAMGVWPHGSKSHHRRFLHRIIMERMIGRRLHSKEFVDHINHDKLDNRRENLRLATHQQNKWNTKKPSSRTDTPFTSKYKGVSLFKKNGRWTASIRINGKSKRLGYFSTEEDAARAYDIAARANFGEFACCNFPAIDTIVRDPVNGDHIQLTTDELIEILNRPSVDTQPLIFTSY